MELKLEKTKKIQEARVAKPAVMDWTSLVVYVSKKEQGLRFCVDYYRLSVVVIRDSCSILRMEGWIDSLCEVQMFPTVDVNSGFWQIKMVDKDIDKVPFITPHGLIKYSRMLVELRNAHTTLQ